MSIHQLTRRTFLQSATLAGAGSLSAAQAIAAAAPIGSKSGGHLTAHNDANIAETAYGKVRGSQRDGISIFRGIPYGADTGGKSRFLPAVKPQPWAGVRSSLWYGPVCPQAFRTSWLDDELAFTLQWDDGFPGEDCLRVNVWTPGLNDNRKRPVMVWIHGGGFTAGSGQELLSYDGERLSRRGDVVVVSFNHRLNIFGFLNLSAAGAEYATSGNVGMTDIVFLLEWVRDNIASFGGDPGNVTIMGQSGGGRKVSTLMAMPSARGLFHKASVHSGSALRLAVREGSEKTAASMLTELGLTRPDLAKLQAMPVQQLIDASVHGLRGSRPSAGGPGAGAVQVPLSLSAYDDGVVVPRQPFDPDGPAVSATVPMMVGSVLNETATALGNVDAFSMTNAQLVDKLTPTYGDKTTQVIAAYRAGHPGANPFQLGSIIATSRVHRQDALTQSQRKSGLHAAPAYNWWFQWQTPMLDGRPMAFHTADLAFFFDNTARCECATGNTPEAQHLAAQMADCWIAFAKTGNPNHPGIPHWDPITSSGSETMIFDTTTRFSRDSDAAERKVIHEAVAAKS